MSPNSGHTATLSLAPPKFGKAELRILVERYTET